MIRPPGIINWPCGSETLTFPQTLEKRGPIQVLAGTDGEFFSQPRISPDRNLRGIVSFHGHGLEMLEDMSVFVQDLSVGDGGRQNRL